MHNRVTIIVVLILTTQLISCQSQLQEIPESERVLTEEHGPEVVSIIEYIDMRWGSYEVDENPSLQSEFLIGPLREYFENTDYSSTDIRYVTDQIVYEGIRVYEYSPNRIVAMACGIHSTNQVTSENELIKAMPSREFRNLYFLELDEDRWKLSLRVRLLTAYDDWKYAAQWERDLVGDIHDYLYDNCLPYDKSERTE